MSRFLGESVIKTIFRNPPTLETKRLILRAIAPSDRDDMFEYCRDCDVTKYLTWEPHPTKGYTKKYIESVLASYRDGNFFDFAIELKGNRKMVGTCGFTSFDFEKESCEVGYVLNPRYRGYGIMPEAVWEVMNYAFNSLGVKSVSARYIVGNNASRRVMEKCRMTFDGVTEGGICQRGAYRDVGNCSITRDRFISFLNEGTFR